MDGRASHHDCVNSAIISAPTKIHSRQCWDRIFFQSIQIIIIISEIALRVKQQIDSTFIRLAFFFPSHLCDRSFIHKCLGAFLFVQQHSAVMHNHRSLRRYSTSHFPHLSSTLLCCSFFVEKKLSVNTLGNPGASSSS
jgi:hypothetical protein